MTFEMRLRDNAARTEALLGELLSGSARADEITRTIVSELAYPAAGTDNALVTLHVVRPNGGQVEVAWDRQRLPYLAEVQWPAGGPLLLTVQSRDQRRRAPSLSRGQARPLSRPSSAGRRGCRRRAAPRPTRCR